MMDINIIFNNAIVNNPLIKFCNSYIEIILCILETPKWANIVDPDQTAPTGAV